MSSGGKGRPSGAGSPPSRRGSTGSSAGDIEIREEGGSASGDGGHWDLANLPRSPRETPASYAHGGVSQPIGTTQALGGGLEARVYGEGVTAFKAFEPRVG